MTTTKIEWADRVWNPVTGCTKVSEGCRHCYAERMSKRLAGRAGYPKDGFKVTLHPGKLDEPLRWKKPARIFVCSMGDLFHEDEEVEIGFLTHVFDMMEQCAHHTFLVLTKRPERIKKMMYDRHGEGWRYFREGDYHPNVWLGVSVEDQKTADERIPILLQVPAAKRFVSIEPMLGPINLTGFNSPMWGKIPQNAFLHWVILGGESGPGARPLHPDWARSVRDQCQAAGVPYFFKQWGEWLPEHPDTYRGEVNEDWDGKYGEFHGSGDFVDSCMCAEGTQPMIRVGKARAGCLLDGKEHKERP